MAISIIGGRDLVSTFLTLYVVPCVYSLFTRLERPEEEDASMTCSFRDFHPQTRFCLDADGGAHRFWRDLV